MEEGEISMESIKIYGGQQLNRMLSEFQFRMKVVNFPILRDEELHNLRNTKTNPINVNIQVV